MADAIVLGSFDAVVDTLPGARPLLSASTAVDLTWLPGAAISDLVVRREEPASLVAEATLLIDPAGAGLLDLGPLTVALVPPLEAERPLLVRITLGAAPSLEIYDLRVAVDLAQPWLHRVDPRTFAPTGEPFRFEVDARLRIAADGSTDCECFGLSIPPFEIGHTGLIVSLEGCRPAVDGVGVPVSFADQLRAAGQMAFDGLYARRARLSWLPQFRFPDLDVPGFAFNFRDVLLDAGGVSFTLDESWVVERRPGAPHRLSSRSEMMGSLGGGAVRLALEHATGTVVSNEPISFALDGWVELEAFRALLKARFTAERDPREPSGLIGMMLQQEAGTSATVDLGVGTLAVEALAAEGWLSGDTIDLSGSAGLTIDLPGWQLGPATLESSLTIDAARTAFGVGLRDVGLGPLGRLAAAGFHVTWAVVDGAAAVVESFGIDATMVWKDIAAQLGFADVPPMLPLPSDNAQVRVSIEWDADGGLSLELEAASGEVTEAFAFLPPVFRPEVRSIGFGFRATFADAAAFFSVPAGAGIDGEAYASLSFRPTLAPSLRDNGVIDLQAGDADGFVDARMRAAVHADGRADLSLELDDPVSVEIGLPGVTDGPLFVADLTHAGVTVQADLDPSDATVNLDLQGAFGVLPASISLPTLVGPQLAGFLDPLTSLSVTGTVSATLQLSPAGAALTLTAALTDAGIEIDVFEQIGRIAAGPGAGDRQPTADQRSTQQELGLDLTFRFALDSLEVRVGDLDDTGAEVVPASVSLQFSAGLAGAVLPLFVKLSTDELTVGVVGADLPLELPSFPVKPADLSEAADGTGRWSHGGLDAIVAELDLEIAGAGGAGRDAAVRRGALMGKRGLVGFIRDTWVALSSADARSRYQDGIVALLTVLDAAASIAHVESDVRLQIGSARLVVPFDDPRAIAVEGGATLTGFAADDPLHGLDGLTLRLGLSPDQIYFALEASGEPIRLPRIGGYENGQVSLSQLSIGYGFTRNSLAVSFAGELDYPEGLTEDLDTSDLVGFGFKLPRYNRLAFRLDLIPVPGPIPVVPLVEFSVDLRTPGLPALRRTSTCAPVFDGLELNIPGLIHADVKALSISPVLGILPAVNVRFDGDLDIGNDQLGLTLVCDEMLWSPGIGSAPQPVVIPFLVDPAAPYFDHLCVNIRCAGFGINFDLERPFPLPNPLLIFEVLALIADPLAPIKPDGPLARSLRIALRDARVTIPPWARRLIPGGADVVRHEIDVELNVGTLISAAQWVARTAGPVITRTQEAFDAGIAGLQDLAANPPRVDPAELLALLPAELRAVACEVSFAGFEASAMLVLVTPGDGLRDTDAMDRVWELPALRPFTRDDVRALPQLPPGVTAVLVVAEVDVFDAVSYRFFGRVADDGGFVLATALDIVLPPIPLPINGIRVVLPLQVSGRLRLEGQVTHRRRVASIVAEGRGRWDVVPGVVRVTAGDARPVRLRLNATGRFALDGEGAVDFFGGALRVDGALSASESHLMVSGTLRFAMGGTARNPAIGLEAAGALHVGPGDRWAFDGDGVLRLYDLRLVDVAVRLSDHEVAVHAALKRTRWRVGSLKVDTHLSGQLDGRIVFSDPAGKRPGAARLRLRGRGAFELLGARLAGSLAIDGDASGLRVEADGTLQWLQKTWIAARVAVDSAGSVEFAGRTSVVLDLTPSDLGIQVASLFLRADFAASFGFNARGAKISHTVDLDWSLGVRLPGGKPGQTFILAMQKLHIGAEQALDLELIHVQGMNFIPMSDVVIPIPVIKTSGSEQFIRARINIPIIDHVRFLMTDGLKDWLEDEFGEDFVKSRTKLFTVPKNFSVEVEDHSLGELAASFAFRVRVRWKDGMLGFEIRKGSERVFIGLDRLG